MEQNEHIVDSWREDVVTFCQALVQTPSLSGEEGDVADLIVREMEHLDYDEIERDRVGNVIGRMDGAGDRRLVLNAHMDQVAVGALDDWRHPPFEGIVADGAIWGRGASDTKGAIAAQVYALGLLKARGARLPSDTYVTFVVHEETGSWGIKALLEHFEADAAILGEATANQIAIGHRGRTELLVELHGRSQHASSASPRDNLLFLIGEVLGRIREMPTSHDQALGTNALTPTRCYTDQESGNVTPGNLVLHLDWRSLPDDELTDLLASLRHVVRQTCPDGVAGEVSLLSREVHSYTGLTTMLPATAPSYLLSTSHPLVATAREVLQERLHREVDVAPWSFATDGGYLVRAGIPTIGFSPCEEQYAHTPQDRVRIDLLREAVEGYAALATELPERLWTEGI